MDFRKTNECLPRALVRFSPNNLELSGNLPKEWIVNRNVFFRCVVSRDDINPLIRSRAVEGAKTFLRDDGGATMVEYAFMVMLIAIVCVATISTIGTKLNTIYNAVANDI